MQILDLIYIKNELDLMEEANLRVGVFWWLPMKVHQNWFFLLGFSKNQRDNINETELLALRILSNTYLDMTEEELTMLVKAGRLDEIGGEKNEQE